MKVVTFGELMVRLQPYNYERFVQASTLEFTFGGGEANVAVSLANYGVDAAFVTKLPAHAIGQCAINSLRRYGVDTSMIVRGGDRVGIYYNEKGASQRGSVCIYDRANSAIQLAQPSDFDWEKIFEGVDWFHFTGITPALGENVVEICRQACKAAKKAGVKISCDLNYRGKLWTREQARAAMTDLCQLPVRRRLHLQRGGRQGCVRHRGRGHRYLRRHPEPRGLQERGQAAGRQV